MKARVQGYPRYYHMRAHLHIGAVCKSTSYRRALAGVDFRSPFKKKGILKSVSERPTRLSPRHGAHWPTNFFTTTTFRIMLNLITICCLVAHPEAAALLPLRTGGVCCGAGGTEPGSEAGGSAITCPRSGGTDFAGTGAKNAGTVAPIRRLIGCVNMGPLVSV